ncbi:MAG TPA: polysaccharide deacetylase family protein [Solirubrobacterales bacterium]|jgi:peptidoglycan/xylan/chitin deacetylase (PgdA/CDA1 family)
MSTVTVRGISGPPGSRLAELLRDGLEPVVAFGGALRPLERVVAEVALPAADLESVSRDLPTGAAQPEAIAARLRASGAELRWEEPVAIGGVGSLLALCRDRGRSSLEIFRADSSLLPSLQLGAWFDAPWRTRTIRRLPGAASVFARVARLSPRLLAAAADLAFWQGAREAATGAEWRRLTASSYVALVYHRFAGELKAGQERIDIAPRRFSRQLLALRLAGFRPLSQEQLLAFHSGAANELPRRRFAITVDDAIADSVAPLLRHAGCAPQLFVPTAQLGGSAHWIDGEPVAGWDDVRGLADAGVAIGSHTRHHQRLSELAIAELEDELAGSLAELRERLPSSSEVLAYPNGDHDENVCAAARAAGYRAAFTTEKGRNGAGTDPYCLRRVSVHGADGALAILWKTATGAGLPDAWLRLRRSGRSSAQPD